MVELKLPMRRGLVIMDHMFIFPALNSIHVKFDSYVHTGTHEFPREGCTKKPLTKRRDIDQHNSSHRIQDAKEHRLSDALVVVAQEREREA